MKRRNFLSIAAVAPFVTMLQKSDRIREIPRSEWIKQYPGPQFWEDKLDTDYPYTIFYPHNKINGFNVLSTKENYAQTYQRMSNWKKLSEATYPDSKFEFQRYIGTGEHAGKWTYGYTKYDND